MSAPCIPPIRPLQGLQGWTNRKAASGGSPALPRPTVLPHLMTCDSEPGAPPHRCCRLFLSSCPLLTVSSPPPCPWTTARRNSGPRRCSTTTKRPRTTPSTTPTPTPTMMAAAAHSRRPTGMRTPSTTSGGATAGTTGASGVSCAGWTSTSCRSSPCSTSSPSCTPPLPSSVAPVPTADPA